MRFLKLFVEAFQGVGRAEINFGPCLNILYGENDLGKSTLACAVRAALLMIPKSTEAERFVSWYADAPPRVVLTFADDDEHFWQVKKVFSRSPSAELLHSKDGVHFTLDVKGREVEEKLRTLLSWGIPSPGGKKAPRGLPVSFLANTLLAAQTDVDAILQQSLADDDDTSGKLRLQKALATLAQDPLFKRVLDTAQGEYDQYFTGTGKLRRTQGSKVVAADEEVKRHLREVEELKQQQAQSQGIEQQVVALHAERDLKLGLLANAEAALAQTREGLTNAKQRALVTAKHVEAQRALTEIDAQAAQVALSAGALKELGAKVSGCEAEFENARAEGERAAGRLRAAEDKHRLATAEQGEQARKLRRAELEAEIAKLRERNSQLEARRELGRQAETASIAWKEAAGVLATSVSTQERLDRELIQARAELERCDSRVEHARAVVAYGRWQTLTVKAAEAEAANQRADEQRRLANAKQSEADALAENARLAELAVTEARTRLPTATQLELLEQTQRALEVAEAGLGGGLQVVVRPRKPLAIRVASDQRPAESTPNLTVESRYQAERTLQLEVEDLLEIGISAGAADKQRAAEELRARWKLECLPLLERAGASSLKALTETVGAVAQNERSARELRVRVETLRAEIQALRERADLFQQQAVRDAIAPDELAARRAAIGSIALESLAPSWTKLGSKESQAELAHEALLKTRAGLATESTRLEQQALLATQARTVAEQRLRERECEREAALSAIAGVEPSALLLSLEPELKTCFELQATAQHALEALDSEASNARSGAERALEAARTAIEQTSARLAIAQSGLDEARATANTKRGEHAVQEQQLSRMDRPQALASVQAIEAEIRALPSAPIAQEPDVAAAEAALQRVERELDEANQAFYKAEGALSKVGGAQLRERIQQVEDALKAARAREREVEIDAHAWRLLRETLRRAENSEGAHLGRALGGPVGERFVALTRGRYANLQFDPLLGAQSLQATGVTSEATVLEALSAGTRDQLATLVRLTIANQLKSAIILDDHLVHTDPTRLAWFREMLTRTALETQVVVFTCRPEDYLSAEELPDAKDHNDMAGGSLRAINLASIVQRWDGSSTRVT